MKIEVKDLEKSQVEMLVELSAEEFTPYIKQGAENVAAGIEIKGFRPGKAPYDLVKQKVGEMAILEAAANVAINKIFPKALEEKLADRQPIGQPQIEITKLAPGNPLEFKATIVILPPVALGEYKNLNVPAVKVKIDEKEVERTIDYLRESRVKEAAVERAAGKEDKVIASIEMFLDKVPVDGGQSKDTAVILGKEYFVAGFDDKIIGAKKGEVKEFSLAYPKDFYQKNLAGKNVEFRVTIKEVFSREMPELNDEFGVMFGAKTLADLKGLIRSDIENQKKYEAARKTELNVLDKILEKTKFGDLPEMLLNNEAEKMMIELEENVSRQGGKMEDYLAAIKKTKEQLIMEMLPEAIRRLKTSLLVREIAEKEKITATDAEVEEKQKQLLAQYKGYAKVEERINNPDYKLYLKNSLANEKVLKNLVEWNVPGGESASAKDAADEKNKK